MLPVEQPFAVRCTSPEIVQGGGAGHLSGLLIDAGFTEDQLSAALGVDEQTVRDWCQGKAEPPQDVVDALQRLAEINKSLS